MRGERSSRSLPLRARLRIEVALERVQRFWPQGLVLRDPLLEVRESVRVQLIDPLLSVHFDVHEPRVAEDLEVTGHGGVRGGAEPPPAVARFPTAGRQEGGE